MWTRELEKEVEEEAEEEAQLARMTPRKEVDWDASKAFGTGSPASFAQPLATLIKSLVPELAPLHWSVSTLYAMQNFMATIEEPPTGHGGETSIGLYLRPLDMLLVYKGSIVLLPEREADAVLRHLWRQRAQRAGGPVLVNFAYLRAWADAGCPGSGAKLQIPAGTGPMVSESVDTCLAALQVFAGETVFAVPRRRAAVRAMLTNRAAVHAVNKIPQLRGTVHVVEGSHLEELSNEAIAALPRSDVS